MWQRAQIILYLGLAGMVEPDIAVLLIGAAGDSRTNLFSLESYKIAVKRRSIHKTHRISERRNNTGHTALLAVPLQETHACKASMVYIFLCQDGVGAIR